MRIHRFTWDLLLEKGGNVMILTAFSILAIAGGAGIATDTIQWTLWQREMQRAADSAALAAALVNAQGGSAGATVTTELARYNLANLTSQVTVAPTGQPTGVKVALTTSRPLAFSGIFLRTPPTVRAEAIAAAVSFGDYCVRSLESTTATGITMQGSATVSLGCGMHTNSQGAPAVVAGGSSTVAASPVSAVGGLTGSSNYATGTVLQPYSLRQLDPYASLANPVVPSPCAAKLSVGNNNGNNGNINTQVDPGCYRGIDIQGHVTFKPGTYIVDGNFDIGAQANVSGSGVTFILTSNQAASNPYSIGELKINGGATVNLTAQTSGTYAGLLFYQDRRASDSGGNANIINGTSSSVYQGAIYMPSQEVTFNGTTGMTTTCFFLVSRRVTFTGNASIDNSCPAGSGTPTLTGLQIRLVS